MPPRRFKFRLQSILEFKEKREEEEQRELGRRLEALSREEALLVGLQHLQHARQEELTEKSSRSSLNVNEIQMYHDYEKRIQREISAQSIRVQQAQVDVDDQRQRLLEAVKEKKTYEKLKEKHQAAFAAEVEAEERNLLDDIATTKFARTDSQEKFF